MARRLRSTWRKGRLRLLGSLRANALFDATWYLWRYPDVRQSGMDPLRHYRSIGAREGREPNPLFSPNWYQARYPDVAATGVEPLDHYLVFGAREARDPSPRFDSDWYLAAHPDVRDSGMEPLAHYLGYGLREGRSPAPTTDALPWETHSQDATSAAEAPGDPRGPAVCTIIARNYLSHARILAESFRRFHPGSRFYLLVVDGLPDGIDPGPGIQLIDAADLELPYLVELRFKYDVTELSTALKPTLLSMLLTKHGEASVLYLDPDILVMRPLTELIELTAAHEIVLIPHLLQPMPLDGRRPSEQDILIAGAYNLGCIGIRKGPESQAFLAWWEERLRDHCRRAPAEGLMVDQRWIDLAPSLFPDTTLLRDETYDVAYWNIEARPLEEQRGVYLVNGRPLAFYHFSGFDPWQPTQLSKHQDRVVVEPGTPLAKLLDLYTQLQLRQGYQATTAWEYGFSRFGNGVPIHPILRELYLGLDATQRAALGDPFEARSADSFLDWATKPREAGFSPFVARLYRMRHAAAAASATAGARQRAAFVQWARNQASVEMGFDRSYVPDAPAVPATRRAPERSATAPLDVGPSVAASPALPTPTDGASSAAPALGVNVVGYLRNESGVGAVARGFVRALRSRNVDHALVDVSALSPNRSDDATLEIVDDGARHDVNLVVVNADALLRVAEHLGEPFFHGRYTIGVWQWELPHFAEAWHDQFFSLFDEIWAGSSFIANALAPVSPVPVVRIFPPLSSPLRGSRERGRARLGVAPDETLFGFVFDFRSYVDRKNPAATIRAFLEAFPSAERARLVLKCVNESVDARAFEEMTALAGDPRISIHAGYWPASDVADLMAAIDAYVSLHRSEGIGLTISEAMALGKPVIATGWSGNMDYMSVSNSYPVRYELVQLTRDVGPYRAGETWADPSVAHAAEMMRTVFERADEASSRGRVAAIDLAERFSEGAVGDLIVDRLHVIGQRRTGGHAVAASRGSAPLTEPTRTGSAA